MRAWRLCKRRYSDRDGVLNVEGAQEEGGRWNRAGLPLVYASENSSLALLETLVNTSAQYAPQSLVAVEIIVPDDVPITIILEKALAVGWREPQAHQCIELGSRWIEATAALVLRVPSAVNPLEDNLLINPLHADISRCAVGVVVPVMFDSRSIAIFRTSGRQTKRRTVSVVKPKGKR